VTVLVVPEPPENDGPPLLSGAEHSHPRRREGLWPLPLRVVCAAIQLSHRECEQSNQAERQLRRSSI
jgi:hypothetical protein